MAAIGRLLKKTLLFVVLLGILYTAVIAAATIGPLKYFPRIQYLILPVIDAGGKGHTLMRLRQAETVGEVDVLFMGSSHAYRSFDTDFFLKEKGIRSFNLGSTSQTPLNSYYLLKQYLPKLKPKILVYEIFFLVLDESVEGTESFYDLSANAPLSFELFQMAWAVKNPKLLGLFISEWMQRWRLPFNERLQSEYDGESYVSGGYVRSERVSKGKARSALHHIHFSKENIEYLERATQLARSSGCRVVWVTQPLPEDYRLSIENYGELKKVVTQLAAHLGIAYFDFNDEMTLSYPAHYKDSDHLNSKGVRLFNEALFQSGLISADSVPKALKGHS